MNKIIARGRVAALHRYPVKSMQGEQVPTLRLTEHGVDGDRAFALRDPNDGLVASAHHPGKWGRLLHCRARTGPAGEITVTLPDGRELPAGAELEQELAILLERDVRLIRSAPENSAYEIVHPDVPDTAPAAFVEHTQELAGPNARIGRLGLALAADNGSLIDVAPVHLLTSAALAALAAAEADNDLRRFRPNLLLELDAAGYIENGWAGCTITIGAAQLHGTIPTPRCIVPTLAQRDLVADKRPLRTLARDNRVAIGSGNWACIGLYANVTTPGQIRTTDSFVVERTG